MDKSKRPSRDSLWFTTTATAQSILIVLLCVVTFPAFINGVDIFTFAVLALALWTLVAVLRRHHSAPFDAMLAGVVNFLFFLPRFLWSFSSDIQSRESSITLGIILVLSMLVAWLAGRMAKKIPPKPSSLGVPEKQKLPNKWVWAVFWILSIVVVMIMLQIISDKIYRIQDEPIYRQAAADQAKLIQQWDELTNEKNATPTEIWLVDNPEVTLTLTVEGLWGGVPGPCETRAAGELVEFEYWIPGKSTTITNALIKTDNTGTAIIHSPIGMYINFTRLKGGSCTKDYRMFFQDIGITMTSDQNIKLTGDRFRYAPSQKDSY